MNLPVIINKQRLKYFREKPQHIEISLTNACNYKCIMCYNPNLKQEKGFIKDELVFKILDECKKLDIQRVALGAVGEPLMHRNFLKYLAYAKSLGLWVSTVTNCSLLTKEIAHGLLEKKIDCINLSIYSSDAQEHSGYTSTDTFAQVVDNAKYFLNLWHKTGSKTFVIREFLEIPGINNYQKFVKYWWPFTKEVGLPPFHVPIRPIHNWAGSSKPPIKDKRHYFVWRHKIRCHNVPSQLRIIHNGNIYPCCYIFEPESEEFKFGNFYDDGIMGVWNSQRYLEFKKDHYLGNISKYKTCSVCARSHEVHYIPCSLEGLMNLGIAGYSRVLKRINRKKRYSIK